jgi:hypothetical protein
VFDRDGDVADCSGSTVAKPLELERPTRAVVDDDDRIRHCARLVVQPIPPGRDQLAGAKLDAAV